MTRHLACKWLGQAEKLAGQEPEKVRREVSGMTYRRKWASDGTQVPGYADVATACG